MPTDGLRTWIEIDKRAARENYRTFRKLIKPRVKLWAVVKSNAYGHGLTTFSKLLDGLGADGFCVDSIVEGNRLRREGITKPILILGHTLPTRIGEAAGKNLTVSVSNFETLKMVSRSKTPPSFHIKLDTGFHRQGFYGEELPRVIRFLRGSPAAVRRALQGLFTHFAAAKDITYPGYTEMQVKNFREALGVFGKAGYRNLLAHAAATGGATISSAYHFDAVRIGMGLYGFHASPELEMQLPDIKLSPVLRWKTVIGEVKKFRAGDYIGYDITERMPHAGTMAILPIGYWHGFSRAFSSIGKVLVNGRFARVLGRVSMDLTVVDVTGIPARPGTPVTLIGEEKKEQLRAQEVSRLIGTTQYELLTRLNPLMERIVV